MQVVNDYEFTKLEALEKIDTYPALAKSDNFDEIEKHALSLGADYLVWFGGYWIAYKSIQRQYTRPEVDPNEAQKIARMMTQIAMTKGIKGIVTAATALGMENARLLAEVNEHRVARGFDPLPEYEAKV